MPVVPPAFAASATSMEGAVLGASLSHAPDVIAPYPVAHSHAGTHSSLSAEENDEGRYVHPTSKALYAKCGSKLGCLRYFPIFGEAVECYGPKFIFTLDFTQFFSKGIAYAIMNYALYPMFVDRFKSNTLEYNRYNTVATMGWSIKPFTALVSDSFAFFGYKKRWVMTFSAAIFGGMCGIILGVLPAGHSSGVPGCFLAFLVGFGQANIDILSEGLYARKIREHPAAGPNMVSTVWIVQMIAGVIAAVTQGPLSDMGKPEIGILICGACMLICVPLLLLNWFEEKRNRMERLQDMAVLRREATETGDAQRLERSSPVSDPFADPEAAKQHVLAEHDGIHRTAAEQEEMENLEDDEELYIPTYCGGALEFNKEVVVRNWRITAYCVVMTVVVVLTAVITALYDGWPLFGVAFGGALILSAMIFWAMPLVVAKAGFFSFLNQAVYVTFYSAMDGFYLENAACPPGYPQFDYQFYNTISGVIGNIAGLAGVVAFSYIFSKRTYRMSFIVTTLLYIVAGIFDLCMVKRWNLPAIPDHYFYVFGDAVVYQAAYMLNWMPMCILLAQLCPRGSEAMVYALLAAFSNHGQTIGGEIGTLLMQFAWPVDVETCQFENLWKLIVFGHLCLPLVQIPLTFIFIPAARVCDELDVNGHAVPSEAPARESLPGSSVEAEELGDTSAKY